MTQQDYLNRYGYLLLVIPPLIVVQLAALLFERSIDPTIPLAEHLRQQVSASPQLEPGQIFVEARARYTWFALALLAIVVPIIAAVVSLMIILRSATRAQVLTMSLFGLFLAAGSLAYTYGSPSLEEMIYGYTYEALSVSGRFSEAFLQRVFQIIVTINVIAAIVPVIMLLGACSTLAPRSLAQSGDPKDWADRMRHLKEILNASSVYLVFGIFHMGAWLQWPAALATDQKLENALTELARAITIYWGVCFSLIIVATYAPAAFFFTPACKKTHHRTGANRSRPVVE
ncbi:MAG: hypothetical protein ACREXR_04600 [Gammaproteobacteria bacterium]